MATTSVNNGSKLIAKSTAYQRCFCVGTAGTTVTAKISKNGGAFATCSNAVGEIGSGWYAVTLTTTETNTAGDLNWHITTTASDVVDFTDQVGLVGGLPNDGTANFQLQQMNVVNSTGTAVVFQSSGSNGDGLSIFGNGSGNGVTYQAGATGIGQKCIGGSTSGDGFLSITTSGHAMSLSASGTAKDALHCVGAAASAGNAGGHGIGTTGGAASTTAGGTAGKGVAVTGGAGAASNNGAAAGLTLDAGGTTTVSGNSAAIFTATGNAHGLSLAGAGTGDGAHAVGGLTGHGGNFLGGATSGRGLWLQGQAGNSSGLRVDGQGSAAGTISAGGATGVGANFSGGATSGAAVTLTTTSGDGLSITPTAGHAIVATGDGTSKHGAFLTGGTAGTSDGLKAVAGTGGVPIRGDITASITGNLSGSVGSVTGAVGSVTGNVGGNVVGSVASVTGAVGSVTGNVGGNVVGSVASVTARVTANTDQWAGGTIPAVNVTGVPLVDLKYALGTIITAATAGIPDVNAKNINNVSTSSVTTINANQGTTQPVNFTGTGASALAKADMVDVAGAAVSASTAQLGVNLVNVAGAAVSTSTAQLGVNLVNIAGSAVSASTAQLGVNLVNISGSAVSSSTAQLGVNVVNWAGGAAPATNVTGVPLVDLKYTLGTLSPATAGYVAPDWAQVANKTSTVALTNTTISTSQVIASVSGAVGSVTGNVGGNVVGSVASVTGAVGSVTGNVGGNVVGSVASVTGAVGSVTGNVGGNVVGSVGSVTGNVGGNVVGNVVGSVASVTGAVGSVTGNVGGNVVGSVASVTGAVGSVTGNVGGNVVGSVASVTARVTANTDQWAGTTIPAPTVTGVPKVDLVDWRGSAPNVLIAGRVDANAQVVGDKTGYSLASPLVGLAGTPQVIARFSPGAQSQSVYFRLYDSAGSPVTGLSAASAGARACYTRQGGSATAITLSALGSATATFVSGGFIEVDATLEAGLYRLDIPNAALADGSAHFAVVSIAFTGVVEESGVVLLEQSASTLGPGAVAFTVLVQNSATGFPLSGASVWVSTDSAGDNTVAGALYTNASGLVTFYLDGASSYFLWVEDEGYSGTNPTAFSVP